MARREKGIDDCCDVAEVRSDNRMVVLELLHGDCEDNRNGIDDDDDDDDELIFFETVGDGVFLIELRRDCSCVLNMVALVDDTLPPLML